MNRNLNKLAIAAIAIFTTGYASAGVNVAAITAVLPDIAAVGAAVFTVYVAIRLTKWARSAL